MQILEHGQAQERTLLFFALHGRACMGFCRHDHAAFSEMACFSGGV